MSIDNNYSNYYLNKSASMMQSNTCTCCCNNSNNSGASYTGLFNFNNTIGGLYEYGNFLNPFPSFFSFDMNFFPIHYDFFSNLNFDFYNFTLPAIPLPEFKFPKLEMPSVKPMTFTTTPAFGALTFSHSKNSTVNSSEFTSVKTSGTQKKTIVANVGKNDKSFEAQLKAKGVQYDSKLGHNLATYTVNNAPGTTGSCAHYVNNSLEANNIDAKRDDSAYTRADVLAQDKDNFTEITVSSAEDLEKLPAGSTVVYGQQVCNYSKDHGHVFIATGDGGAVSDHIQNSIKFPSDGKGIRVFIPTKSASV